MAALLTNEIWIYGNDDGTLFRLICARDGQPRRRFREARRCAQGCGERRRTHAALRRDREAQRGYLEDDRLDQVWIADKPRDADASR